MSLGPVVLEEKLFTQDAELKCISKLTNPNLYEHQVTGLMHDLNCFH